MRAREASGNLENYATSACAPEFVESVSASEGNLRDPRLPQGLNKRQSSIAAVDWPRISSSPSKLPTLPIVQPDSRAQSSESQNPSVRKARTSQCHPYQDVFQAQEDLKRPNIRSLLRRRLPRDMISERYLHDRDLVCLTLFSPKVNASSFP